MILFAVIFTRKIIQVSTCAYAPRLWAKCGCWPVITKTKVNVPLANPAAARCLLNSLQILSSKKSNPTYDIFLLEEFPRKFDSKKRHNQAEAFSSAESEDGPVGGTLNLACEICAVPLTAWLCRPGGFENEKLLRIPGRPRQGYTNHLAKRWNPKSSDESCELCRCGLEMKNKIGDV